MHITRSSNSVACLLLVKWFQTVGFTYTEFRRRRRSPDADIWSTQYILLYTHVKTFCNGEWTLWNFAISGYHWNELSSVNMSKDRLCGIVVRVSGYRSKGPGLDSRRFQISWEAAGPERGPIGLVRTTEKLLEGKVAASVYKTEINDRRNPLRWPRGTLHPQKLALLRQQAAVARSV
jgi:hypothetical protein